MEGILWENTGMQHRELHLVSLPQYIITKKKKSWNNLLADRISYSGFLPQPDFECHYVKQLTYLFEQ